MVKGLSSPDPIQRDLMRTWSATPAQIFWKLRWPSAVPFLFTSLKVSITISLIGAIVAELPTGAQAGIGARLLAGSYYGQTIQIWAALVAASVLAVGLIGLVSLVERWVAQLMGARVMTLSLAADRVLRRRARHAGAAVLPLSSEADRQPVRPAGAARRNSAGGGAVCRCGVRFARGCRLRSRSPAWCLAAP